MNNSQELIHTYCVFLSSLQRLPTPNPAGSGCPLVFFEWTTLPIFLPTAPPGPAARAAEWHGSAERRVLGQRTKTPEGGVWIDCRDSQPASQLMSYWLMWLTHPSMDWMVPCTTDSSESIKRQKIWQLCWKATMDVVCDNIPAVRSSDKQPDTKGAVSGASPLLLTVLHNI